jgi:hypothetical protein
MRAPRPPRAKSTARSHALSEDAHTDAADAAASANLRRRSPRTAGDEDDEDDAQRASSPSSRARSRILHLLSAQCRYKYRNVNTCSQ